MLFCNLVGRMLVCVLEHNESNVFFFFFKQKTAYELRISDWSSDVCSSDLLSKASAVSEPRFSSGPPPLTRTPPRAARATPERTALGVAMASAQGLAATSTAIAR